MQDKTISNSVPTPGKGSAYLYKQLENLEVMGHFALPYEVMIAYDKANTQINKEVFSDAVLEAAMFSNKGWGLKKFKPRPSESGGYYAPTCDEGLLTYLGKDYGCDMYIHLLLTHRSLMFKLRLEAISSESI